MILPPHSDCPTTHQISESRPARVSRFVDLVRVPREGRTRLYVDGVVGQSECGGKIIPPPTEERPRAPQPRRRIRQRLKGSVASHRH